MVSLIKKLHKVTLPGFTLVEFIMIMSIFAVMIGVVLFNFKGFRSAVTLDNLAHDIAISIRQIQASGGASLTTSDPTLEVPRGIYFEYDNQTSMYKPAFTLFEDTTGDGFYTESMDKIIDTIKIQTPDRISTITYNNGDSTNQPLNGDSLAITFKRFKTDAMFESTTEETLQNAVSVTLTIVPPESADDPDAQRKRTVTISKIGQVSIN